MKHQVHWWQRTRFRPYTVALLSLVSGFLLSPNVAYAAATSAPGHPPGTPGVPATTAASLGALHTTSPGFDTCSPPDTGTMQTWWTTSPYTWVGIYTGGINRSCKTPPSSNWVATVAGYGWKFLPIYVGEQAPAQCVNPASNFATMSSDPATAQGQGSGDASDAVATAQTAGFPSGSIVYNDMEYYSSDAPGVCNAAVAAYLKGWTQELHARNVLSGVYIAGSNTASLAGSGVTQPDDAWVAAGGYVAPGSSYNSGCTPYGVSHLSDTYLHGHRLYQTPVTVNGTAVLGHAETWGGVTIASMDSSCADGEIDGPVSHAPTSARTPTVVTHPDGRLEAFMVGATGALYHTWQTSAGGGWTSAGWVSLGGNWPNTSRPIVATDGGNQLEVFLRGTTGNLYVNTEQGGWANWKALGTFTAIGDPTVVRNPDGRLEVFAVGGGSDHSVWHDWQTSAGVGNWAYNWSNIGGYWPNGNPTVATDGSNQLEVLMRGTTGNIYVNTQQGGWSAWNTIDSRFTSISDPTVARNPDGRLEVFAVGAGSDHSVWHDWQTASGTGNWHTGWSSIGGNWPNGKPTVALDGSNQLEVLMRGTTGNIYVTTQQSGWSAWNAIDSRFTSISDPTVTRNSDGRLEVFAVGGGSDHSLWHNWQASPGVGNWNSGWSDLGGYWPN